jgi:hypothetical protein
VRTTDEGMPLDEIAAAHDRVDADAPGWVLLTLP